MCSCTLVLYTSLATGSLLMLVWPSVEAALFCDPLLYVLWCMLNITPSLYNVATLPVTVWGQTVSVSNVSVTYQQQAVLGCSLIGYLGAGPVIISIDKVSGPVSTSL